MKVDEVRGATSPKMSGKRKIGTFWENFFDIEGNILEIYEKTQQKKLDS
jgi:hypothetical protein